MARYRKKPVVIEAVQWDGSTEALLQIKEWLRQTRQGYSTRADYIKPGVPCVIVTLEGDMTARKGDWIIRGVKGELYPCRPDIFLATYELVEE